MSAQGARSRHSARSIRNRRAAAQRILCSCFAPVRAAALIGLLMLGQALGCVAIDAGPREYRHARAHSSTESHRVLVGRVSVVSISHDTPSFNNPNDWVEFAVLSGQAESNSTRASAMRYRFDSMARALEPWMFRPGDRWEIHLNEASEVCRLRLMAAAASARRGLPVTRFRAVHARIESIEELYRAWEAAADAAGSHKIERPRLARVQAIITGAEPISDSAAEGAARGTVSFVFAAPKSIDAGSEQVDSLILSVPHRDFTFATFRVGDWWELRFTPKLELEGLTFSKSE